MSDKPSSESGSTRVHRRGPQAFAGDAGALLKHHLANHGFADADLVTRWAAIAGASLAQRCLPQRLSGKGEDGATLTLVADDRAALELQHQTPQLISKINTYFGRTVVKKIKVIVGDLPQPVAAPPPVRALTSVEEAALAASAEAISDPDLKAAFVRLGRRALADKRKGPRLG